MQHFLHVTRTFVPRNSLIWSRRHQINIKISLLLICSCTWNTLEVFILFFFSKLTKAMWVESWKTALLTGLKFQLAPSRRRSQPMPVRTNMSLRTGTQSPDQACPNSAKLDWWKLAPICRLFCPRFKESMSWFIVISMYLQLIRCLFYFCTLYTEVI